MMTTTETYHPTIANSLIDNSNTIMKDEDPSLIVGNVTIDELVESCCNEVLPSSSSSQLNSSSASPTHLVRFVHSQSSLLSQIDEPTIQQTTSNINLSSHDIPPMKQAPFINVTRLPSPFSAIKPKTIIESTNSMYNTTNLTNITANNISVNNYNVNIHTTNVQQPTQTLINNNNNTNISDHSSKTCNSLNEKQTTEIVTQILKNIKEVDNNSEQIATNYNIHIDSFNFSSSNEQQTMSNKKTRIRKEAKTLTKILVKDDMTSTSSPNCLRNKKAIKTTLNPMDNTYSNIEFIPVPYGWQRRILAPDFVVYISPTNIILDSLDAVRQYVESPTSCKCGLQCPLFIEKVFNFDANKKSKSWEVVQVLEGTHCRQKSNILEMATLTNCIDLFSETEQKPAKRRKRLHNETTNGNVFVCASNVVGNSNNESVVFINNTEQMSESGQSMTWTPAQQTNITPPSKRPRGRPRKTAVTSPTVTQLAAKPSNDLFQSQPVPSSILSPPASVSSMTQANFVHRNSTSPHHQTTNIRHVNDNILTPPILSNTASDTTNVIARVPAIIDQVKTTTNESTFAVLSGVQNVLMSPSRDANNNEKRMYAESASSIVAATGKQVALSVNGLKSEFVRSASAALKPCVPSSTTNQIDVISLMGTNPQTTLNLPKTSTVVTVPSTNSDDFMSVKSSTEQINDSTQPLMIDFNDPSTTTFLLSALASGTSSDSNAIVNHLFQKAQAQQQQRSNTSSPPSLVTNSTNAPTISVKKNLPIITTGLKNCTETTNLLPLTTTIRPSVVLHVPSTNDYNQQTQQIILNNNNSNNNSINEEKKAPQQIFYINNKPYIIQQKIVHDQSSQQRLILTPSISQSNDTSHSDRNVVTIINSHNNPSITTTLNNVTTKNTITSNTSPAALHNNNNNNNSTNNSNACTQPILDDGGNCLLLNGPVEPKTLRTLLKGLNSSSVSGVDNIIDTINRLEHSRSIVEQTDNVLIKSIRPAKTTPSKRATTNLEKPAPKRRTAKSIKQEEVLLLPTLPPPAVRQKEQQQQQQFLLPSRPAQQQHSVQISLPQTTQSVIVEQQQQQQQWQTDFNSFDFSTSWGSDTNLNSLLLSNDFDTAASFDDVNFGDFEPYMNGNNLSNKDFSLPSLFVKPLATDGFPNVDHLLQ